MISLKQVVQNKLSDFTSFLKKMTVAAVMRLFNKKKKEYDALITRVDSLIDTLESTSADFDPDVSSVDISSIKIGQRKTSTKSAPTKTLVGNTAIPLGEFVVPDRKKLAQQVSELAQIEQSLVEVDGFFSFAFGLNTAAGKAMKQESVAYRAVLEARAEKLTTTLQELSFKHEPAIMKEIREKAYSFIIDKLPPGTYGQPSNDLYVSSHDALVGNDTASIQFTCFIYLPMLDKDVFKSGDLTIALTGIVSLSPIKKNYSMELHVTSLNTVNPRELHPGTFDPGEKMSGADTAALITSMKKEIDALLSLNRLKPELASMRLGPSVTQQALRESAILNVPNVVDADVINGKDIIIHLKEGTSEKQANNAYFRVVPILHRIPGLAVRRTPGKTTRFIYNIGIGPDGNRYLAINKVKDLSGSE